MLSTLFFSAILTFSHIYIYILYINPREMLAEKFANSISSLDTFLSPNVYSILSCSIKYDYAEDYPCLVDGFVIWDAIDKMLDVKG